VWAVFVIEANGLLQTLQWLLLPVIDGFILPQPRPVVRQG